MAKDDLQRAIEDDDVEAALARLAACPELARVTLKRGRTYLMDAAGLGEEAARLVTALLEAGADPNARSDDAMSPILSAIDANRPPSEGAKVIEALVLGGADVEQIGPYGWSPLMFAVERGGWEEVEALIAAGARVDGRYPADSPLAFARGATLLSMAKGDERKQELLRGASAPER